MVICSGSLGNEYISFVFQSQYRSTWSLNSWLLIDSSPPGWCLVAKSCPALWDPMNCSIPGFPVLHYLLNLLKFMSVESIMPSNHLICHPFLLLPSIFPSIRAFSEESAVCIRWPKYWASTSVLLTNTLEWSPLGWTGWISLQSKGLTLKSLLQHHSSKATILRHSAFFLVQLSHPYMTTGKTIALTRQTFVS